MIRVLAQDADSGLLNRMGPWRYSFTYRPEAAPRDAVSLTMPIRPESWLYANSLHPVFDMNLPEGVLRHWLERSFAKVVEGFDDLELLRIVGGSQVGRLRYEPAGERARREPVPVVSSSDILLHRGTEDLFESLLRMYARSSGVSGVQPKVLILSRERRDELASQRVTVRSPTHIVKTWGGEFPELALNEHLCLQAARAAGLDVARTELSRDRKFLLVDRFDMAGDGSFLGFEDACVLMGLASRRKYESSYEKVAKTVACFVDQRFEPKRLALRTLFAMVALSVAVRNGDAHLKNFGLLYASPEHRFGALAPVFDVVCTAAYLPEDMMALSLEGSKRWPGRKKLAAFGKRSCNLTDGEIRDVLESVAAGVDAARAEVSAHAAGIAEFKAVGVGMLRAFEEGLQSLGA